MMATHDNTYSRLIAWLKIILPLTALAILSTLFLFSRTIDTNGTLPFTKVDAEKIAREQRIGNPTYSAVSDNGTAITLAAESAAPLGGDDEGIGANNLTAVLETPSGLHIQFTARSGWFDAVNRVAALEGGVKLETSSGYIVETDSISANVTANELATNSQVTASGPLGELSAGKMVLRQQSTGQGAPTYELIFQDGVKLVYRPKQ